MLSRLVSDFRSYVAGNSAMPHSHWRQFLQIIVMVGRDLKDDMITLRAMSLVYTTLLSIVPLLAVSISVLKGFGVHDQLQPTLARLLAPIGDKSAEISAQIIAFVDNMRIGVLGAVGLILLIYTAISLIQKIESAFNQTWRLKNSRNLIQRFTDYLSVIMVGPVLIFAAVGITASLGSNHIVELLNSLPYMSALVHLIGKLLPYVLVIAAFTFIYLLVPNTKVKFGSALYGAAIAGVLWETAGLLFASLVGGSGSYAAIYSGFAILLVFMIWLYLSWLILLIGSTISFYHQHPESLNWNPHNTHLSARMREQLALQVMVNIARAHDRQLAWTPSLANLASNQQVPADVLARMLDALQRDGLVQQSADSPPQYLPGASLQRIGLGEILNCARAAEDEGLRGCFQQDDDVAELLEQLERSRATHLAGQTLADFLTLNQDQATHEDSLI